MGPGGADMHCLEVVAIGLVPIYGMHDAPVGGFLVKKAARMKDGSAKVLSKGFSCMIFVQCFPLFWAYAFYPSHRPGIAISLEASGIPVSLR